MSIVIRPAQENDKEFIISAIVAAEKSGGEMTSYGGMFRMDEPAVRQLLSDMLDEDVDGQEVCIGSFLIAEVDGVPAAACAGFVEGEKGMASGTIKGNLLMHCVPRNILLASMDKMKLLSSISPERTKGALQIESVYTVPEYRGRGLFSKILEQHIVVNGNDKEGPAFAEVIFLDNNNSAKAAYLKAGFEIVDKKSTDDPAIYSILSGNAKTIAQLKIR